MQCATNELLQFAPPSGTTCGTYLGDFVSQAGGYIVDAGATDVCQYCQLTNTSEYLEGLYGLRSSHAYVCYDGQGANESAGGTLGSAGFTSS